MTRLLRYMVDYQTLFSKGLNVEECRHHMVGPFRNRDTAEKTLSNLAANPDEETTKMRALTFALTLLPLPALAGALIIPPEEYDKPYDGELYERTVPQSEIRARCPGITMKFALGCSVPNWQGKGTCLVLIAPDKDLKAAADPAKGHYFTRENVRRHEIGHCHGWPADHKGAREAK